MNAASGSKSSKPRAVVARSRSSATGRAVSSLNTAGLLSVNFEIRGKVQGVHFRKYTKTKANSLKIRGWCRNTVHGTVVGCMEGERVQIDMMKDWLKRIGSPKSQIDGADFKHAKAISSFNYDDFQIV